MKKEVMMSMRMDATERGKGGNGRPRLRSSYLVRAVGSFSARGAGRQRDEGPIDANEGTFTYHSDKRENAKTGKSKERKQGKEREMVQSWSRTLLLLVEGITEEGWKRHAA